MVADARTPAHSLFIKRAPKRCHNIRVAVLILILIASRVIRFVTE